ncbi:Lrp/AsnC family transcriptional regulator [Vitiosangium sp. GDMCC 1.1324]|uniref:Lrp/AsnC family transcriptional regulator n=1 Tax=Vitiosangium sp. (strain GDMCC 1.1324) TaxID=2138576 RepID=UPI000D3A5B30|nr:Lrp/AsnC family transcriptional regulator [Vitiosangium sp. GDMCC 1.1324]PTL81640.1 Lrp/AsnC family transcriptional regulator [Vitiosangium sp. GDMCC 1.1324]
MDELDYRIVDLLQRDGRATQLEISRTVGLSQPAVAERIRKLEERGVITSYTARVDAAKLGKDITAFIGVSIEHPKYFEGFAKKVLAMPEVLEAHRVAGQDSYILKVRTSNTKTLDTLLVETLRTISGVTRTHTTIVLSSIKEETYVHVSSDELKGA